MKNGVGAKIMTEFVVWKWEMCSYITNYDNENKKNINHKNCFIRRNLKFQVFNYCL